MLSCKQLDEFLVDFLDGELPFATRLSMQMHLGLCRPCREFVSQYQRAIELGREAFVGQGEFADVPEALVQAVLESMPGRRDGGDGGDGGADGA